MIVRKGLSCFTPYDTTIISCSFVRLRESERTVKKKSHRRSQALRTTLYSRMFDATEHAPKNKTNYHDRDAALPLSLFVPHRCASSCLAPSNRLIWLSALAVSVVGSDAGETFDLRAAEGEAFFAWACFVKPVPGYHFTTGDQVRLVPQ